MSWKLGSLFDGSGGFPLAGFLCDIEPRWASEVEPYPIAVTRSRFPKMKHLGDISKINGAELEPVDVITFGSPCQDLSVAGKRAGLKHEANGDEETTRSGLFMEAVRIIKEMREATNGEYPRFALWENVPGAFSSNKGEDFRIVLEELIKIVEPTAVMSAVPKKGWAYADSYVGDGWSIAYRVFDAQYWGVPQRRRRIHLVLDLGGECAREVLFEREGVRGYFTEGRTPWQGTAGDAEGGVGADDREGVGLDIYNLAVTDDVATTLTTATGQGASNTGPSVAVPVTLEPGIAAREGGHIYEGVSGTLRAEAGDNRMAVAYPVPNILLDDQGGQQITVRTDDKCPTLRAEAHGNVPCVLESAGFCTEHSAKSRGVGFQKEVAPTLRAGVTPACVYSIENHPADSRVSIDESGKVQTLTSRMGTGGGNVPMVLESVTISSKQQSLATSDNLANTLGANDYKEPQAVAYTMQGFGDYKDCGVASGLKARDYKDATDLVAEGQPIAFAVDCRNLTEQPELYQTLQAKPNGGQSLNFSGAVRVRYIVRRLTPTECARLQGFADCWGDIDGKDAFTPDEFRFWREVRQTHDAINGKKRQEYTEKQILAWYNKLHTDSAEYKMWGNGIALPPALYCMQGIADALNKKMEEKNYGMDF